MSWPSWLPLRADLQNLSPYGAPQIDGVIHLNTNENPFPLPTEVAAAITSRISEVATSLNRYPDRDAMTLRTKLARYINGLSHTSFTCDDIWAANGSNEILQTLLLACGGSASLVLGFTPSYSVHPLIAQITGTPWIQGNRTEDFELDVESAITKIRETSPKLVFVTTPNNPTGNLIPLSHLRKLAESAAAESALLIIDEAYQEFSTEDSAVTLISEFANVVVTRTMSKAFAFAGARVGYLIARPELVHAMLIVRLPYHLSAITQAAAEVALEHQEQLQAEVQLLISERERVVAGLLKAGLRTIPSSANFLLFTGFPQSSADLWQRFLDRGVLIRDVGLAGYLRVTIGSPEENDQFLAVLEEIAA